MNYKILYPDIYFNPSYLPINSVTHNFVTLGRNVFYHGKISFINVFYSCLLFISISDIKDRMGGGVQLVIPIYKYGHIIVSTLEVPPKPILLVV